MDGQSASIRLAETTAKAVVPEKKEAIIYTKVVTIKTMHVTCVGYNTHRGSGSSASYLACFTVRTKKQTPR